MITEILELILHLDKYLQAIVNEYAAITYFILFMIILLETGIVIFPFLPGDSLLFSAGALAATGALDIGLLFIILFSAAVIGDTINYHIGKYMGPKIFKKESSLLFHKEYLVQAQEFYKKHGKKTLILARFIPIVRTFAPFVAGIGVMSYRTFLWYNVIGAALWCAIFLLSGFLFGNIPWIKDHFGLLIIAVIIISFIPILKEVIVHLMPKRKNKAPVK